MVELGEALAVTNFQSANTTPELFALAACRLGALCIMVELGDALVVTIVKCANTTLELSTLVAC
ncbi:hypothetical protein DPMN_103825 [Dreissena polymorpha]|uniref:Uncharacterized protein n=1 Tax=Dreissena polymorpha TaxID=45954 RepID=A0A9D4HAG8_DREPO|nr:hypothetical protein DPMN_103825 [Dreissena polymorpha]